MNKHLHTIALTLYILIGLLFIEKYALRVADVFIAQLLAVCYIIGIIVAYFIVKRLVISCRHPFCWIWGIGCILGSAAIVAQYSIDPMTIRVDRWSAIYNFLQGMFSGVYPYGCQTHLGGYGSPFPVWQVLHIPFYLLGNVGLSIFVVSGLFIWTLYKCHSTKVALITLVFMFLSPCYWYEILVRSDLVSNLMLSAIIVDWLAYKQVGLKGHIPLLAVISGLLLSTRFCAVIPLCVLYGYEFLHIGWKKQLLFVCVTLGVFVLTFLPFLFWKGSTLLFFEYSPFVLQTRQGSPLSLILFAIVAVAIVIYMKNQVNILSNRTFSTGVLLNLLVLFAFIERMWRCNTWGELFGPQFDITYFSMAIPFYIEGIACYILGNVSKNA